MVYSSINTNSYGDLYVLIVLGDAMAAGESERKSEGAT